MPNQIPEADWKVFREIHPVVLARFCERILSEIVRVATDTTTSLHERYLLVFELIQQRNRDVAAAFDELRRSTAVEQLAVMQDRDLLTKEEFARFSPDVRASVTTLIEIYRR